MANNATINVSSTARATPRCTNTCAGAALRNNSVAADMLHSQTMKLIGTRAACITAPFQSELVFCASCARKLSNRKSSRLQQIVARTITPICTLHT